MFQYLRRQPSVLEMIMQFIDVPAAADLLIALVQLDQDPLYLPVVDVRLICLLVRGVLMDLLSGSVIKTSHRISSKCSPQRTTLEPTKRHWTLSRRSFASPHSPPLLVAKRSWYFRLIASLEK